MKTKRSYLICILALAPSFFVSFVFSQSWTPKANFGGTTRSAASGFSIGTKGYITLGEDINGMNNDLWEWDQPTNAWTQKANFPGKARCQAGAFSVGTKGYVGTGFDGNFYDDFYEWDQATNTWTQKANVPGGVRGDPVCFHIGNKGYLGTGYLFGPVANDFYEYDPVLNTWTQMANVGGMQRYAAAGFAIGTKGYIGTGVNIVPGFPQSTITYLNDFWEWSQSNNTWTQKANFPGTIRGETSGFSIGKHGYMGIGTTKIGTGTVSTFYKYDPVTNAWIPIPNFGGGLREMAASFSIGCYGYIATGFINDQQAAYKKDLWEYYDPTDTTCGCTITASANGNTTICSGSSATLTASGGTGYAWTTGGTTSSIVVSPTSTSSYSVVVSNGSSCTDLASVTVTIAPPPVASVNSNQTICAGQSATLSASGGSNYSWSNGATTTSIAVSPTTTTNYSVTVSNGPSCSSTAFVTITVSPSPVPTISGTILLCQGDATTLTASNGSNYTWNTGVTSAVITVNPSSTTSYTVVSTNSNGCTASATVTVSVAQPPIATVSGTTICAGQTATLTAGGVGNYSWSNGATTNPIIVSPTANTTYSVIVSAGSCVDTAAAMVTVVPGVTASISGNTVLCLGDKTTLTASGGGNYSWNTGSSSNIIVVQPVSNFVCSVVTSNANGCTALASITVTVSSPPIASASGTTVCMGQNAILTATGGGNYSWSNGATTSSITVTPISAATYSVIVSIGSCVDTASASVGVVPSPTVVVSSNVTITQGQSTTLSATGGGNYTWSNGETTASISVAPAATTTFCVVADNGSCSDTACVIVVVEPIDCSFGTVGELFIPNAFSPNGDGENERLKLLYGNYSCIDTYKFAVYNRWGEKVFESEIPGEEWDGTYNGKLENTAVFAWYMTAVLVNGDKIERKGNISLVR